MSKIRIKYFGPIKKGCLENKGWITISDITVFIGGQGSGKSTIAKIYSTFSWMEKALTRGDYNADWFEENGRFRNIYCAYHRLENYFSNPRAKHSTFLEYMGDSYHFLYEKGKLKIKENSNGKYQLPQVMYVPAERNFISTIKNPKLLKLSSDSLIEFLSEFQNAKLELADYVQLPFDDAAIEYNEVEESLYVKGKDYSIDLTEASSGFQSTVPLFLVTRYLAQNVKNQTTYNKEPMSSDELKRFKKGVQEIWSNDNLNDEQKRVALSVLSSKFNKTSFINIVEEPEQNLFPSSQRSMLNSLVKYKNGSPGNKLIVTTHSPYIISYLTIAIQGGILKSKTKEKDILDELYKVVPEDALIKIGEVNIYELNHKSGEIKKLKDYDGIPSDANYLNQFLHEGNELFDRILELEQEI